MSVSVLASITADMAREMAISQGSVHPPDPPPGAGPGHRNRDASADRLRLYPGGVAGSDKAGHSSG